MTIRNATVSDHRALDRLAQLDSSVVPYEPVIVAEENGDLVAAMSLHDGAVIADPFTRSADAVALLHRRARQFQTTYRAGRLVHRLRLAH
jgi:hypothetical protein